MMDPAPEIRQRAVDDADLRVLLMCLVHLTGDLRWLDPPFTPRRDARLVAAPDAGLPAEVQQEIRSAALQLLTDPPGPPAIVDPGPELMLRMMRVCLGEDVPAEYSPMMREELGFVSRDVGLQTASSCDGSRQNMRVLIVGAGVSGLALGAQLGRLGVEYTIVDRATEVGGTWWLNRYPGCGVDTPNHSYSYSFGRRNAWTRYFSLRDEILAYLVRCADEFGVRPHLRLATELAAAEWDEARQLWRASLVGPAGAEVIEAEVLVSAIGGLNVPKRPTIAGADQFAGDLFHSAQWPDQIDLRGRDVAIIGTGATSMQLAPAIADEVRSLTIYQRSPQWVRSIEGYRDAIGDGPMWMLQHMPFYVEWFRFTMMWRYGDGLLPHLRKDPNWPHPERSVNRINDRHRQEMADFLTAELEGRDDLIERCMPTYPPYGKRILLDNGWFRTLRKPNVELVVESVDRIDNDAIVTADGRRRQTDAIVLATGFETTQLTARIPVRGRDGVLLSDEWADDNPTAHLGLCAPGFPNLFFMLGPNTGLGHGGSAIFQSECQARYISAAVLAMAAGSVASMEVRRDVHDEYVRSVDNEHEQLIWTHPGMTNWYRNKHARVVSLMPWRLVDYWAMTHDPDLDEFILTPR
jgi:4-hydroxyacetophenone monooxygenase